MYTIIFKDYSLVRQLLKYIPKAKKYSNDVVLSTWKGQNSSRLLQILKDNEIKIIELDDPETIISFEQNGRNFYLNIKRHLYAFYEASKIANMIIFLNVDVTYHKISKNFSPSTCRQNEI